MLDTDPCWLCGYSHGQQGEVVVPDGLSLTARVLATLRSLVKD